MENKETFSYTYSAEHQDEVRKIREKYLPKEMDKMEQLRKLDRSVTKKGTIISLILGIVGTLIFGTGMSCCLLWEDYFIVGIIVGIIGVAIISTAYPVYNFITKKEREKITPEIIQLTDEHSIEV